MFCQVRSVGRAVPQQARSRATREAILDAAALAFAARGVGGTTMETIATNAGISIGAVYRLFVDRDAVFAALTERCLERSQAFFAATVTPTLSARPWREALRTVVRAYTAFYASDPSFRAVWRNLAWSDSYVGADVALREAYATSVAKLLASFAPLPPARRRKLAGVVVELVTAVLMLGEQRNAALERELELVLERYLAPELAPRRR